MSMTTIHNLPVELLYKILAYSYPYTTCDLYRFYELRRVCHLWKEILDQKWLYLLINTIGNYNILHSLENDSILIKNRIHEYTQLNTIETNNNIKRIDLLLLASYLFE